MFEEVSFWILNLSDQFHIPFTTIGFILVSALVLCFAWISTGFAPLNYYVWLVHLSTYTRFYRIQVFSISENDLHSIGATGRSLDDNPEGNSLDSSGEELEPGSSTEFSDVFLEINNAFPEGNPSVVIASSPSQRSSGGESPADGSQSQYGADLGIGGGEETDLADDDLSSSTTIVIVQTPSSVTNLGVNERNGNGEQHDSNSPIRNFHNLVSSYTQGFFRVGEDPSATEPIPSSTDISLDLVDTYRRYSLGGAENRQNGDDAFSETEINAIHHVLLERTDSTIATVTTMALHNHRIANNFATMVTSRGGDRVSGDGVGNADGSAAPSVTYDQQGTMNASVMGLSNLSQGSNDLTATPNFTCDSQQERSLLRTGVLSEPVAGGNNCIGETSGSDVFMRVGVMDGSSSSGSDGNEAQTTASEVQNDLAASSSNIENGEDPRAVTRGAANTPSTLMTVRLKFLDDSQKLVKTSCDSNVGEFKRQCFAESMASGKVVRLIFQGQLLRDDARLLTSYGIHDQCVLHCHIGSRPYQQQNQPQQQRRSMITDRARNLPVYSFRNGIGRQPSPTSDGVPPPNVADDADGGLRGVWPMFGRLGACLMALDRFILNTSMMLMWSALFSLWRWASAEPDENVVVDENNNNGVIDQNNNNVAGDGRNGVPNVDGADRNSWRTDDTLITYYWRICVQRLRSAVRIALCCCFGADVLNGINEAAARGDRMTFPEDGYRLSVGSIFGLLFALKFAALWFVVFYFPHFTDAKSVFLLSVLTLLTAFYFIANRPLLLSNDRRAGHQRD